jgi:hypothetical protein
MLPGYHGHLVAESFLEQQLDARPPRSGPPPGPLPDLGGWRRLQGELGPASPLRAVLEKGAAPLLRGLGFDRISPVPPVVSIVSSPADTIFATARGPNVVVGLLIATWGDRLDQFWRLAVVQARAAGAEWCLLFNGTHLRLIHCQRVYSRRYAEFELALTIDQERSMAAVRLLVSAGALRDVSGSISTASLVQQSDHHAAAVCGSLRSGVLAASENVLTALIARRQPVPSVIAAFEQTLTLIYRTLFLLFAEARALVPLWHPVYRESYSLESLRDQAVGGTAAGIWDALRAAYRLAHAGCDAGDLHVTAFNGRLFAPARTPLVDRRDLDDGAARRALIALSTRVAADGEGREPISYRDLGVEQLGGVYETLLDYAPHVETSDVKPAVRGRTGRTRLEVSLRSGSGVRKATGTFYTPQPLAHYLIRQSLDGLTRDATPEAILKLRVLDPSVGSGAFLVAACSFLAEAYEAALIQTSGVHPSDISREDRARFRRTIAERCLYGVDVNPMAVQLARLSLWLSTLAADRPLSFLDHHLVTGDSLMGAWLGALRRPPGQPPTTAPLPLFDAEPAGSAVRHALPIRFSLALDPNDTPQQVRAKERALAAIGQRDTTLSKWKRIADLWCAHWFAEAKGVPGAAVPPGLFSTLADAILTGQSALPAATTKRYLDAVETTSAAQRFFHWELEFPEVFFSVDGERLPTAGFDAVIGNPPWDMIRADSGAPESRAGSRAAAAAVVRFSRDSGIYTAQSGGQANRYQLFLERAVALTRPGGRIGLVMPWGLAADHGSARLRRQLFSQCTVDALVGLDNRRGLFPIHRSVRFLLLTATRGGPTREFGCRLGEDDPAILETAAPGGQEPSPEAAHTARSWSTIRLSPDLLERLSGDSLDVPMLKLPRDLSIIERAATLFPPLGSAAGWQAQFGREVNGSDDRDCLRPVGEGLPIVEGKLLEPFRVNLAGARSSIAALDARRLLGDRHQQRRLAYRDVASATNRLTLIAALLPPGAVSTHTVFCLRTALPVRAQHFLCGLFNSLVVNYLVRLRVSTHVTTAIVERLPIPRVDQAGEAYTQLAALARLLALRPNTDQAARLNAIVARLYGLTRDDFAHVLGTFPLVPEAERDAALDVFRRC